MRGTGATGRVGGTGRTWTTDAGVCLVFLALALWLTHGLWTDPATRALAHNAPDQALNEWFLAHGVLFWTGDLSLHTLRLNVPDGVNLMSNASIILQGILLAPVTATLGAHVSFALLVPLNLAATAAGWYLLFTRELRRDRVAAMVGALFAGFAPGMMSQSNSHPHMTTQWLVPAIVWCVIRLARSAPSHAPAARGKTAPMAYAVGLAALVCAQVFLGEEVLYLTAVTMLIFSLAYAAARARWARRVMPTVLGGLAFAAGLSGLVLFYPLWMQLAGPMHTPNAMFPARFFYADLLGFVLYSPLSLAGWPETARLATSHTELNTYFGLPLIALVTGLVAWRRHSPSVVAAAVTIVVMGWLSLGPTVTVDRQPTRLPSLYQLIADIPVIDSALPTRYALALIPLMSVIIVDALDALHPARAFAEITVRVEERVGPVAGAAVPTLTALALLPLFPLPLPTTDRAPVPQFITSGAWRECVPEGGVLVPIPLPTPREPDRMRWAAAANAAFGTPEGFFFGPYGRDGRAAAGIYPRPTSRLLTEVARTGVVPQVTAAMRAQAQQDIAYWRADCVALAQVPHEAALKSTLEQLLGPGRLIADTWTWPVTR